jgi:HupE / UreJ protein
MSSVASAFQRKIRIAAALLLSATPVLAHDIPASVVVQAYVRPEGDRLRVIVRAPLAAMRDVVFPLRGDGLLDLARTDTALRDAALTWIAHDLEFYEGDTRLQAPRLVATRAALPSDRSFETYDAAFAHVTGPPLSNERTVYWNQALLDVLLDYPIRSDRSTFSVRPSLARLGVHVITVLRYQPPSGAERAFEYAGDPGLVHLDPRWHQAALQFVRLGFQHILSGTDHLLFLFCLVIPFRRLRSLVAIVTSFTVAHSITLIASATNLAPAGLWFPPLIETLIAASIVYMALENIFGVASVTRRWMITFAFGLVHGFGFSFALRETLQFAGSHLLTSLLSFNVGVELGQLLVLAVLVPALAVFFRSGAPERTGTIVLSAIVAHTAWHWTIDRWDRLRQFRAPTMDVFVLLTIVRWTIAAVFVAAVIWLVWPRITEVWPRNTRTT